MSVNEIRDKIDLPPAADEVGLGPDTFVPTTRADRIFAPFAPIARWIGMDSSTGWLAKLVDILWIDCPRCFAGRFLALGALMATIAWLGLAVVSDYVRPMLPVALRSPASPPPATETDAAKPEAAQSDSQAPKAKPHAPNADRGPVVFGVDDPWLRARLREPAAPAKPD